jgi:hypothetical protein
MCFMAEPISMDLALLSATRAGRHHHEECGEDCHDKDELVPEHLVHSLLWWLCTDLGRTVIRVGEQMVHLFPISTTRVSFIFYRLLPYNSQRVTIEYICLCACPDVRSVRRAGVTEHRFPGRERPARSASS